MHTNSFLYSPELYLSDITQNYSNIRPEAISSDKMMGGLDTVVSVVPRQRLRRRLNHDNGPPYFQPSSPARDGVIINNYNTIIICLTTAQAQLEIRAHCDGISKKNKKPVNHGASHSQCSFLTPQIQGSFSRESPSSSSHTHFPLVSVLEVCWSYIVYPGRSCVG